MKPYWIFYYVDKKRGKDMTPQEKLDALESQVVDQQIAKLQGMVNCYANGDFEDGGQLKHLDEMCKLAHQVRSLLNKSSV
jgi:hypothetical protein